MRRNGHLPDGPPRVLVTDGQERSAVAVLRSLRRAGYSVTVAADCRLAAGYWSRHCSRRVRVPDPYRPGAFVEALRAELLARRYALLLAGSDVSLLDISRNRDALEPHVERGLNLAPPECVENSLDKAWLAEAAAEAGLPGPPTIRCEQEEDAVAAAGELGYPVVVKPRCSVIRFDGRLLREPSRPAADAAGVRALFRRYGECLVQPLEPGTVHSFAGVAADGRVLAAAFAVYLRTWPPEAGNAALAQTLPIPAELTECVGRLLEGIRWTGIFELELLRRPDGSFSPLDLNPRPYGSLALAIAAGADLPAIWAELGQEREQPLVVARPGVRYRWEDAELRRVAAELRSGHLASAATVARPYRGVVHPHLRWDDPLPLGARALYLTRNRWQAKHR